MKNPKMSKNLPKFRERFQNFYNYYCYQQKRFREQADKASKANDITASSVLNGKADAVAEIVGHIETLLIDFKNLVATGKIEETK